MHEDRANHRGKSPHHVVVLALPAVVAYDLTIATHVFGHAGRDRYRVTLAAPVPHQVQTTSGFAITTSAGLESLSAADTVIVPGFDRRTVQHDTLYALREAHARGTRMVSICTGAFALARAGLLDGHRATTHWAQAGQLAIEHPAVSVDAAALYIDGGDVLTSAGVSAGIDLCLYILAKDHGEDVAIDRARQMVTPLHRAGSQLQFIPPTPAEDRDSDSALTSATDWAREHLHESITVLDLARQALQAPRTFSRNFTAQLGVSPHHWITHQRLQRACHLLEDPDVTIDRVAARSGLGTADNLRLHFRRAYATTPTAYRAAFTTRQR